jgi:hypothetical protein
VDLDLSLGLGLGSSEVGWCGRLAEEVKSQPQPSRCVLSGADAVQYRCKGQTAAISWRSSAHGRVAWQKKRHQFPVSSLRDVRRF